MQKPNFVVDADSFRLLRDDVGEGKIVELSNAEVSLIAPHIDRHPETIYAACSGVNLVDHYGVFCKAERQIAVEWVRHETKPKTDEPECNNYRYLIGLTTDGTCLGYDVTKPSASAGTGQVADHWSSLEEVVSRHFPE